MAVFNDAASATIARATAICTQRGEEYQDSWATENIKTPFLSELLPQFGTEFLRLVTLAALCDVKLSRLNGGWKDDTALDLINYVAAYTTLRNQFIEEALEENLVESAVTTFYGASTETEPEHDGYLNKGRIVADANGNIRCSTRACHWCYPNG